VTIADAHHMAPTVKGVETQEQLELLHTFGCVQMSEWLSSAARSGHEVQRMFCNGEAEFCRIERMGSSREATCRSPEGCSQAV
jgi:hypothetical protein